MTAQPGWYDDGSGAERWWDGQGWSDERRERQGDTHSGPYVVLQVSLKEKFMGTGSNNLVELERVINHQASLGYRLHTITTASSGSAGFGGGERIQATMVFEKLT